MALTAIAIKNAKGRAEPYKLTDGDGLFLYVTPGGGRYWRMNYRHLGKQKTLAFGVYPDTCLAAARERRDAARKILARGDDPAENTINAALRRMGFAQDEMTGHGFRAMATLLNERGCGIPTRSSASLPIQTTTPCAALTPAANIGTSGCG